MEDQPLIPSWIVGLALGVGILVTASSFTECGHHPHPRAILQRERTQATQLMFALHLYAQEYDKPPLVETPKTDIVVGAFGIVVRTLIGAPNVADNPKEFAFFEPRQARGHGKRGYWPGDENTPPAVRDYWGRPFVILIDGDGNGKVTHPDTGEIISAPFAVFSRGENPSDPEDDANSWKAEDTATE